MSSRHHESDTEGSCDSSSTGVVVTGGAPSSVASPSISNYSNPPLPPPRGKVSLKKKRSGRSDWEILEGLKEGQTYDRIPKKFEGFILKKRKWPLKGYHKRYFMLEKGLIVYGKSGWDIARGKIHGSLDTGLSVITTKPRDGRVDIDAEDCIYHLKIKPKETYMEWLEQLKQHRLYRQHFLSFKALDSPADDVTSPTSATSASGEGKDIDKELNLIEKDLSHLQGILDNIPHSNSKDNNKKDKDDDGSKRDFCVLAKEVVVSLHHVRGMLRTMGNNMCLREIDGGSSQTLRHALNQSLQQNAELKSRLARIHRDSSFDASSSSFSIAFPSYPTATTTTETMKSYSSSMSEYYDAESLNNKDDRTSSDEESFTSEGEGEADSITSETSDSKFDTQQSISSKSTSGNSSEYVEPPMASEDARRAKLPVAAPSGSEVPSLWGILRKNIGKDLSRISMPVALNEPLGVLQRMCEELEYSELLDSASKESDAIERMAMIAAFAVSGYASAYYRTHKPFNPLHGETFECVRDDKGFRFVSEQVSHHPPVSACHAEGRGWMFWAEIQPKTKFWGKSMEIQPIGENHIVLPKWGEHYSYNKATTCVHNVFSPPSRWVDLYGEVSIVGGSLTCNLTFVKVSYWTAKKNEVFGTIVNSDGTTLRNLYGHWNEAFYMGQPPSAKCYWRLANMPDDHTRYYGFSRFAIELNEMTPSLEKTLPITDTRFRPDQRLLENGKLSEAESMKMQIEQKQRDRRKQREEVNNPIVPFWFKKSNNNSRTGDEQWEFTGDYWELRKNGFKTSNIDPLW